MQNHRNSNSSQKQNITSHANFDVNKGELRCHRGRNVSHFANSCKYINKICNLCKKKWGYLSKVSKSNNSKRKVNSLNTVDILYVNYDNNTTH